MFACRPAVIFPCVCTNGTDVGLYVRCENVNLATLSVAVQNLAGLNVPVEHLTIFKGHFGKFSINLVVVSIYIILILKLLCSAIVWSDFCKAKC